MRANIRCLWLAALSTVLCGCGLITYNEVFRGVTKQDANWVRDAARKNVMTDRGVPEINDTNVCGERALHLAIQKEDEQILLVLVQEGADLDLPTEIGREASMWASLQRSTSVQYAPPGYPPLHYAVLENKPRFAEVLLFAGADATAVTGQNQTVADLIGDKSGFETVTAYLEAPLHLSARAGNLGRVRELAEAGADLRERLGTTGSTPLEEGLLGRKWPVVDYLLERGAADQGNVDGPLADAIDDYLAEHEPSGHTRQLEALVGAP